MWKACICWCFILFLTACSNRADQQLAHSGKIDETAPIKASAEIMVNAPAAKVWSILVDIQSWPSWQHDIAKVSVHAVPAPGVKFNWSSGGGTIHSRIVLYQPQMQLAWTGELYLFHAIHLWTLTPMPNGQTLIRTDESMSGWPISVVYSSTDLLQADQRWLSFLKKKAESEVD